MTVSNISHIFQSVITAIILVNFFAKACEMQVTKEA